MTRLARVVVVMWCAAAAPHAAHQLPPRDVGPAAAAIATASIAGRVTAADGKTPIRGAEIVVRGGNAQPNSRPWTAVTDEEGAYEITGLAAGTYTVTASKTAFVSLAYGQTRPQQPGRSIQLATGEATRSVDIALPRGGVIVVRVADLYGDPAAGYQVQAYQPAFSSGKRTLTPVTQEAGRLYATDDRGEIRLAGLPPGEYIVDADPPGPSSTLAHARGRDPQTFYPGTVSEADAQTVFVGLGEEVAVSFQMAGARNARISGVVQGSGRATGIRMMRRSIGGNTMDSITPASDGTFSAANLTPGDYTLVARGEKEAGSISVMVSGEDIDGLVIQMHPAATVKGYFSFDGAKPPSGRWTQFRVGLADEGGFPRVSTISNDWTFEAGDLTGTGVLRLQQPPSDWFLRAVLLDGKDVTDTPLDFRAYDGKTIEVAITQRFAEVTGIVVDPAGRPVGDYVVVAFPDDRAQWTPHSRFILTARPDQNGRFTIRGLRAGGYFVRAVRYLAPGQERDPATLDRLRSGATALAVAEEQSQTLRLTVAP